MADKKYQVICYIRIEPEDMKPMTFTEAQAEAHHLKFLQPENFYVIEEVEESTEKE